MFGGGARFLNNALNKKRKLLTVTVILIVTVFIVFLNNSYAYLEKSVDGGCVNLEVGMLNQELKGKITVAANTSEQFDFVIKNTDTVASKYQLYYTSNNDLTNILVGYANTSLHLPSGDIAVDEEKQVKVVVQNNSSTDISIEVGVRGGLATNAVEDIILEEGQHRIKQVIDYDSSAEVDKEMQDVEISVRFYVYNDYYSQMDNFHWVNNKYKYVKYNFIGSCNCTIQGDTTTLKSMSAPGWSNPISGTLDISNYSEIFAYTTGITGISSGKLDLIFTNTP